MSRRWHQLMESGDDFVESTPLRYVNSVDVPVSPQQTWAALTADETLVSWTPLVTGLRWTSPRPFCVGTTREVTILGLITARERYYRWDEGRRKTFTAVQTSVPGLRLEPHPALMPLMKLTSPITSWATRGIARGLRTQV